MKTYLLLILLVLSTLFTPHAGTGRAQDMPASLRTLAEKNNFHIGAAVYTYHLDDPLHAETLSREFNMLTPENEAKFCEVQPQKGQFDFSKLDRLIDFAEQNNMVVRGHTLLWHQCVPSWLEAETPSREEAIQLMRDHITTVVGHYRGRIAIWDVVNEAIDDTQRRDTLWQRWIGDDYIELAFQFAHEADPEALLFYNDYGTEGLNPKSDAVYDMLKDLVARGVPVNGVGLQSHFVLGSVDPDGIAKNIARLGELGLQVQITEMDVKFSGAPTDTILQQEAGDYRRVLETCLDSPYCTAFVVWGVTDKFSWLRSPEFFDNPLVEPLLFDDNYQPKPAYYALLDVLARRAGEPPILTDAEVAAMLGEPGGAVDIPEPTKSDPAQLAPDSVPGTIYYAPFPVSITLDGQTDDWVNIPRVTVDSGPLLPSNHDTSMTFAVAADAANLYFLAEVKDSKLVYGLHDPSTEWYKEDSIEFYLNTTGDLTLKAYQPGVTQIGILAANITQPDMPIIGGGNSADSQVSVYAIQTEDGYLVEAAVPLVTPVWSITPVHLGTLGFQAHLNGSSATDRDTKLIWSLADTQDQSWTNPSLFGRLIFWDTTQ